MLAAALALCAARVSSTAVFTATSRDGLTLTVADDDSYTLGPASGAWLQSGELGFHSNGTWYVSPAPPRDSCASSPLNDTDCRGDDVSYFNTTLAQTCCAACAATAGCGAWTFTGETRGGGEAAPPPWANRCYLKRDCNGRTPYAGHTSGVAAGATAPLVRVHAGAASGRDARLGAWTGYALGFEAAGGVPFTATFKFFADVDAFVFEHSFPAGITLLNLTAPVNSTTTPGVGEFESSTVPSTAFPAFLPGGGADAAGLGSASWAGRFALADSSPAGGAAGALARCGGAEGGPVVMWAPPASAGAGAAALVLSPMTNFKGSIMGAGRGGGCATGLNGYALAAPAGFTVATVAVYSAGGITDAVHAWGRVLQTAYATRKIADPASTTLTFWTDNGAPGQQRTLDRPRYAPRVRRVARSPQWRSPILPPSPPRPPAQARTTTTMRTSRISTPRGSSRTCSSTSPRRSATALTTRRCPCRASCSTRTGCTTCAPTATAR